MIVETILVLYIDEIKITINSSIVNHNTFIVYNHVTNYSTYIKKQYIKKTLSAQKHFICSHLDFM